MHQHTGAEVAISAGAEQEQVVADIGPAPAPEVLAQLLNGSRFNFLILSSAIDPHALDQVILSSRPEGPMPPPRPQPRAVAEEDEDADAQPKVVPPPVRPFSPPQAGNQNPNSSPDRQGQPGAAVPPDAKPAPGDTDIPD